MTDKTSQWQPIETAPRGRPLILGARSEIASTVLVAELEGFTSSQGDPTKPRAVIGMAIFYPSHWMPLPEMPR